MTDDVYHAERLANCLLTEPRGGPAGESSGNDKKLRKWSLQIDHFRSLNHAPLNYAILYLASRVVHPLP